MEHDRSENSQSVARRARSQFDRQATAYSVSEPHASGESLRIIARLASARRHTMAVDIATGPGFTAFALAPYCQIVVATDISGAMLRQARRLAAERGLSNVCFSYASANNLPFADGTIDLIACRTAPHHFHDVPGFVAEVERALAPGGTFLLADNSTSEELGVMRWHHEMEVLRDPSHVRNLPPSEWVKAIERAGLRVEFETITRVEMTFSQWIGRAGTPTEAVEQLRREWRNAPPGVVDAFRIEPVGEQDFRFSWPCYVAQALKLT